MMLSAPAKRITTSNSYAKIWLTRFKRFRLVTEYTLLNWQHSEYTEHAYLELIALRVENESA